MSSGAVVFYSVLAVGLGVHFINRMKPYLYYVGETVYVQPVMINMEIMRQRKGFFGNEYLFANGEWYAEKLLGLPRA